MVGSKPLSNFRLDHPGSNLIKSLILNSFRKADGELIGDELELSLTLKEKIWVSEAIVTF